MSTYFGMQGRNGARWLILVGCLGGLAGCSALWPFSGGEEDVPASRVQPAPVRISKQSSDPTSVPITSAQRSSPERYSTVEILWTAPTTPVDGFVVSYGFETGPLNNRVMVPITELQRLDDPQHGNVYRYMLRNIPSDRELQVAIASYRGESVSVSSPATSVPVVTPQTDVLGQ